MKISDVARYYLDRTDKRDHITIAEAADALDTIRAELSVTDLANMPADASPESFAAAYNKIIDAERPWYAVMKDAADDDWSCGAHDRKTAEVMIAKLRETFTRIVISP